VLGPASAASTLQAQLGVLERGRHLGVQFRRRHPGQLITLDLARGGEPSLVTDAALA